MQVQRPLWKSYGYVLHFSKTPCNNHFMVNKLVFMYKNRLTAILKNYSICVVKIANLCPKF